MSRPKGKADEDAQAERVKAAVIEKGVPIPGQHTGYMVELMKKLIAADIGDSMFIAGKNASNVGQPARKFGNGWFVTRAEVKDGVQGTRIWKTKEPPKK